MSVRTAIPSAGSQGLSEKEVTLSRKQHGENRLSRKKTRGFWQHLLENFGDPMIKILLIALGVNVIVLFRESDWYETAGIAAAVLFAVVISTLSERGSESAFKRLQEEASRIRCRVIRRAGVIELPVEDVVVGDLIRLQSGDKIPADGFLGEGRLEVDQSALNGETKEALKTASPGGYPSLRENDAGLLDMHKLFGGTVVCAGEGVMRVTSVGDHTFYGKLAGEIQEEKGESPLKERLAGLAGAISKFGYAGAGLVALAYLFNVLLLDNGFQTPRILACVRDPVFLFGRLLHAATLAVTVIVMAVPEGLPMMITVVLSSNMRRMLKDNVLVRKLVGVETAGSLNILFTDKTGTLTYGRLQVTGLIDGAGRFWDKGDKPQEQPFWTELHSAVFYNSSAVLSNGKAIGGNVTDRALLTYVSAYPVKRRLTRGRSIPFDSRQKYMATEVSGEMRRTLIKGAPELLLPLCREYVAPNGAILPFSDKNRVANVMKDLQNDAGRLIAITSSANPIGPDGPAGPLRLIAIMTVRDDVRREAVEGVRQIRRAGIQVVMITGDAKATAQAIARRAGLLTDGPFSGGVSAAAKPLVLTSEEMALLDDQSLAALLPRLRVVARALPQDKSRLVRIAQSLNMVAGMTGDGVNDAPALKRADIGFAMGSGTEVAKEAGDIVILDDNLLSIAKAIRYGRTVFKSIRKFIIFQLTLNFCAVGISVIAPLIGVDAPITVIQMLWINMVMDTLAGLAFSGEQALMEYMREAPKKRGEPIINRYMWREIILGGLYAVAMCLWFLKSQTAAGLFRNYSEIRFLTAFFALFMFTGIFSSFCARTHHVNLLDHLAGNKPFLVIMGSIMLTQLALIYFGGPVFRTNGLTVNELLFVLLLSSTAVLAHLARKMWYEWRGIPTGT